MLKIEFKKEGKESYPKCIVNGIMDEDSFSFTSSDRNEIHTHFFNDKVIQIINNHSFDEVKKLFSTYSFSKDVDWWNDGLDYEIKFDRDLKNKLRVEFQLDIERWSKPWSIIDFSNEFIKSITLNNTRSINYYCSDGEENILNGFGIEYDIDKTTQIINDEIKKAEIILQDLLNITIKRLLAQINSNSIVSYFEFPNEIKQVCCQYLIYFSQFMADIGIEVNSEIKEDASQILFKVTPKDKESALEFIREALTLYLNAPSNPNFNIQSNDYSNVALKQWESNIYHLKSQLALINSMLEVKNATIEALQLSNYQYRQLLSKYETEDTKKEELIEGIVTIKEYDGKGFSINLAEILRIIKRKIK